MVPDARTLWYVLTHRGDEGAESGRDDGDMLKLRPSTRCPDGRADEKWVVGLARCIGPGCRIDVARRTACRRPVRRAGGQPVRRPDRQTEQCGEQHAPEHEAILTGAWAARQIAGGRFTSPAAARRRQFTVPAAPRTHPRVQGRRRAP